MSYNITIIQSDVAFGDPLQNREAMQHKLLQAKDQNADIIVLPELWTTGYDLSRFDEIAEPIDGPTHQLLGQFAEKYGIMIVGGSVAEKRDGGYYNTMIAYDRAGERQFHYSKVHRFRLMNEEKYLLAGERKASFQLEGTYMAGLICYDIRFPEWVRTNMLHDEKILFVVAEWPLPRVDHWRSLLISRAIENQCFVVACNRVGSDPNNQFGGHSLIIDPWGNVIAEGDETEQLVSGGVDVSQVEAIRQQIPIFRDRRPELYE
ncbi:carbon-nitrogen family hydrolase [Thalassobacillus sp. CUG 92003]|uniref:carbon-nitrogen family hydrolase n=1 Tax=Thalassobacillus sp. CUG 92003 TaxID=2736641 RepID=UPI0015E7CDE3|nr:carbon-nitrogen family hydrolase [Thalassobacillus sp. CUG 92003]